MAVAGETATWLGITGWNEGEANHAVQKCFAAWLKGFGGMGNKESRAILEQVKAFLEAHGNSRFEDVHADDRQRVANRVGFFRMDNDGGKQWLVLPQMFQNEVCKGFNKKTAITALLEAGWLVRGSDGRATQKLRIQAAGSVPTRCYVLSSKMWEA